MHRRERYVPIEPEEPSSYWNFVTEKSVPVTEGSPFPSPVSEGSDPSKYISEDDIRQPLCLWFLSGLRSSPLYLKY